MYSIIILARTCPPISMKTMFYWLCRKRNENRVDGGNFENAARTVQYSTAVLVLVVAVTVTAA